MEWRQQCGVHGKLHSPKRGRPSTTISSRRPSSGSGAAMSKSRTMTLAATHLLLCTCGHPRFHSKSTPPKLSSHRACCTMVAKGVKGTATSAEAGGQRQEETKAALEQHTEQVTLNPIGRCSGESHSRSWATLRSEQGLLGGSHGGHDPQAEIPLTRN